MVLRGVRPELKPKACLDRRRVTKVGLEVNHWPEGWGPLNKGARGALGPLPDVSNGGERHDRFGVVVGEGVVEPRIKGRFAQRVDAGMHTPPLARAVGPPAAPAKHPAQLRPTEAPDYTRVPAPVSTLRLTFQDGEELEFPSDIELAGLSEEVTSLSESTMRSGSPLPLRYVSG